MKNMAARPVISSPPKWNFTIFSRSTSIHHNVPTLREKKKWPDNRGFFFASLFFIFMTNWAIRLLVQECVFKNCFLRTFCGFFVFSFSRILSGFQGIISCFYVFNGIGLQSEVIVVVFPPRKQDAFVGLHRTWFSCCVWIKTCPSSGCEAGYSEKQKGRTEICVV